MKKSYALIAISILVSLIATKTLLSQSTGDVVIIELPEFNGQLNMDIYSFFAGDPDVQVINSCDALGWVVLSVRSSSRMSMEMAKTYVGIKAQDILVDNSYTIRNDKNATDVLEECRAEMQRQVDEEQ